MLNRILVPLDGSETAEAILPHVRRLLHRNDSEVLLLRVVSPPLSEEQATAIEGFLVAARAHLEGVRERLAQDGVRVSAETRVGPPAQTILEAAAERQASMIAMATHGRSGVARALLGSVAELVVRKSPVPVLVVRPFWSYEILPTGRTEDRPLKNILVPTDRSELSMEVLDPVIALAKLFDARVTFLHVLEAAKPGAREGKFGDAGLAGERLKEFAERAQAEGVQALEVVNVGDPAAVILARAREFGCDLIAMTTHGRSGLSRLVVGSVTEKVLRDATLPVLVVRASGQSKRSVTPAGEEVKR